MSGKNKKLKKKVVYVYESDSESDNHHINTVAGAKDKKLHYIKASSNSYSGE